MTEEQPYYEEEPEWYMEDALRDEGVKKGEWTNLGSDDPSWIREGGMLYAKLDGSKVKVLTNYDLEQAVGGREAERMAEKEGGRYRIHEVTVHLEELVDYFPSHQEMSESLESDGYPEPSDIIVEIAREKERAMNMSNTNNFWDYLKSHYGIHPPDGGD